MLLLSLVLWPFFGFSQQEQPKKVNVVILGAETKGQVQIVQLPANNLPLTVVGMPNVSKSNIRKTNRNYAKKELGATKGSTANLAKSEATASNEAAVTNKPATKTSTTTAIAPTAVSPSTVKNTSKAANDPKKTPAPVAKPKPAEESVLTKTSTPTLPKNINKNDTQKDSNANAAASAVLPGISKEVKKVGEETATIIKLGTDTTAFLQVTHSSKVNSFSYIWIGILLIVAGIVLGLLFGKPAFLVSFVGVVFITLGLII